MCSAPLGDCQVHVGYLFGFRADDAACGMDCEDDAIRESHEEARNDDDEPRCECGGCWRSRVRDAHTQISAYRTRNNGAQP